MRQRVRNILNYGYILARLHFAFSFLWPPFDVILGRLVQDTLHIQFAPGTPRFNKQTITIFATPPLFVNITEVTQFPWPRKPVLLPTNIYNLSQIKQSFQTTNQKSLDKNPKAQKQKTKVTWFHSRIETTLVSLKVGHLAYVIANFSKLGTQIHN